MAKKDTRSLSEKDRDHLRERQKKYYSRPANKERPEEMPTAFPAHRRARVYDEFEETGQDPRFAGTDPRFAVGHDVEPRFALSEDPRFMRDPRVFRRESEYERD